MSGPNVEWPAGQRYEPMLVRSIVEMRAAIQRRDYPGGRFGMVQAQAGVARVVVGDLHVVSSAGGVVEWVHVPAGHGWSETVWVQMLGTGLSVQASLEHVPGPGRRLGRAVQAADGGPETLSLWSSKPPPPDWA